MVIYRITSLKYKDILIKGPDHLDLATLEEEWSKDNSGVVVDFALWLIRAKGFEMVDGILYQFKRG